MESQRIVRRCFCWSVRFEIGRCVLFVAFGLALLFTMGALVAFLIEMLEQAVPNLNRLGFPNRDCSDSTCWLGGGQQGWLQRIRRICAIG